ncbi:ATP-binding cassette domain-containing protein [Spiroplasma endosymbiont of Aspidapion aeneum]|uniref:ATP-binding cassette domain-containing protein n=1 Tax=Spiroplasma endosymbiont of Aspidapion aeneum TaxID=3066276 RepID=UPI00313BD95E
MNTLFLNGLKKSFKGKEVLRGINIEFKSGKIYALLGLNGVGKTTTIKSIFNEIFLDEGEILLNGEKIKKEDYSIFHYFSENDDLPKDMKIYSFLEKNYFYCYKTTKGFSENLAKHKYIY